LAYDYPYGPSDLITNGKNGYLIAPNTPTKMIQTAVKLLKNPARLQKMSAQAYELSRAVDAQHVWKQWQTVIKG
jgi:Glycosyl transferases group 1.